MSLVKKYEKQEKYIRELAENFDAGNYFVVVILAPQVFERMLTERDSDYQEDLKSKCGDIPDEEQEIYRLYDRLLTNESIKARLGGYLLHFYEAGYWDEGDPKQSFKKYFSKMEAVISMRNTLAHTYFRDRPRTNLIKSRARECFEILDVLLDHHLIY